MRLFDQHHIQQDLPPGTWERVAYDEFAQIVSSKDQHFPCTLGVAGLAANQIRFGFISDSLDSAHLSKNLAALLQSFVPCARSFGKNTSLVVFFKENRDLGQDAYEAHFWNILSTTAALDARAWPKDIPPNPNDHLWEFSFAGEPIFVVCNTPSHRARKSRYAKHFMMTFQPRWVFEGVIGEGAPNSEKIKSEIRRRLTAFDDVPPSPDLGAYGEASNREWKQYFLRDTNAERVATCPFHRGKSMTQPEVVSTPSKDLKAVIAELLPPTGSVEVQLDTPFRVHEWHHHTANETLHILDGEITFEYAQAKVTCKPGDRLLLPALTMHRSQAGSEGCFYVISTRIVRPAEVNSGGAHA